MTIPIDPSLLAKTSLGALAVIGGVTVKNSMEQLGVDGPEKYIGMGLFGLGWLTTASALSGKDWGTKSMLSYGASLIIFVVVMMMKMIMESGEKPPMYLPVMFAMAWLALGYSLGIIKNGDFDYTNRNVGIFSAVLVILSMLMVLPWQRENKVIDGPGLPMFVIAWVLIALVNSIPGGLSMHLEQLKKEPG